MKRPRVCVPVWGVLLAVLVAGWTVLPEPETSIRSATISGKVLDAETRIPIANARVDLLDLATSDTVAGDVRTDSAGNFSVTITGTAVDDEAIVSDLWIGYPGPNPVAAGQAVAIPYAAPNADPRDPEVELYDVRGRRVPNSDLLAAGQYFVRLRFADGELTRARGIAVVESWEPDFRLRREDRPPVQAFGKGAGAATYKLVVSSRGYHVFEQEVTDSGPTTVKAELEPLLATPEADEFTYDVTYNSNTVVVEGALLRESLIEADTVGGNFIFSKEALDNAGVSLEAGQTLVLSGVALRKIADVSLEGDEVVVATEFAALNDAIESGTISWNHEFGTEDMDISLATVNGKGGVYDAASSTITFKYKAFSSDSTKTFEILIKLEPGTSDTTMAKMTCQVVRKASGDPTATLTGTAHLKKMKSKADMAYAGGELQSASYSADETGIEIELKVAAAAAGLGDLSFKMPDIAIPLKFFVGVLPVTVKVKVTAVLKLVVPQNASATGSTKMTYSGSAGFEYQETEIELKHSAASYKFGSTSVDSGASIGVPVDVQYGVAFPNIEVVLFGLPIVPELLVGFVLGSQLTWGPVCKKGYVRMDVKAGAKLKMLGIEASVVDKLLFRELKESECGGG